MLKYLDQPSFAWRKLALLKAAFGKLLNSGPAAKLFCTVSSIEIDLVKILKRKFGFI